jgi:hydroxyacylglutathione hydrolase
MLQRFLGGVRRRFSTGASFNILFENDSCVVLSRPVTQFQQNQSLLGCKKTGEAAIIDAGGRPSPFIEAAERKGLEVWHLLQTHGHIDHVSGLKETKELLPAALLYLHPDDLPVYDSVSEQSRMFGVDCDLPLPDIDKHLEDGMTITVGEIDLEVVHTPGHSPGHVIFVNRQHQFVIGGDLLFENSIGRTDLPLCDSSAMENSIRKLYNLGLSDDCLVFPGHMSMTTLGEERKNNQFVQMWVRDE